MFLKTQTYELHIYKQLWGVEPEILIVTGFSNKADGGVPPDHTFRNSALKMVCGVLTLGGCLL